MFNPLDAAANLRDVFTLKLATNNRTSGLSNS